MNTEKLVLRPIEDADIDAILDLLNDASAQQLVGGSVRPVSKGQALEWLVAKRSAEDTFQFAIDVEGQFCGYIQLVSTSRLDGHATLGLNILREFQGQGVGKQALHRLHEFARQFLLLRKVILYVRADNSAAIRLYSGAGYRDAGTLQQHIRTTEGFVDLQIMEIML